MTIVPTPDQPTGPRSAGPSPTGRSTPEPEARALLRRRGLVTAAWSSAVALALLAAAAVVAAAWAGDLPDPVASHWGSGGTPDGFASLTSYVTTLVAVGAVSVLGFGALAAFWGRSASTRRLCAAVSVWVAGFLAVVVVGSLHAQRGLADAATADGPGWLPVVAVLGGLVLAVPAALVVHPDPPLAARSAVEPDAPRATVHPGERAAWVGRASGGPMPAVIAGTAALLVAVAALTREWELLVIPVVVALALVATAAFTVRVAADGLTVRSVLGWPRTHVPAAEVLRADAVEVRPLRDFGGYGWRLGRRGRTGVVLRAGEALEVTRTGGRRFVVTVDDAARAAALLNTLADRSRSPR